MLKVDWAPRLINIVDNYSFKCILFHLYKIYTCIKYNLYGRFLNRLKTNTIVIVGCDCDASEISKCLVYQSNTISVWIPSNELLYVKKIAFTKIYKIYFTSTKSIFLQNIRKDQLFDILFTYRNTNTFFLQKNTELDAFYVFCQGQNGRHWETRVKSSCNCKSFEEVSSLLARYPLQDRNWLRGAFARNI